MVNEGMRIKAENRSGHCNLRTLLIKSILLSLKSFKFRIYFTPFLFIINKKGGTGTSVRPPHAWLFVTKLLSYFLYFLKIILYFSSIPVAASLVWQYRLQELGIFGLPVFSSDPYWSVFEGGMASKVWFGTDPEAIV